MNVMFVVRSFSWRKSAGVDWHLFKTAGVITPLFPVPAREHPVQTDAEEKKMLNKVIIFVFFAHKNNYRSFITLRLNH